MPWYILSQNGINHLGKPAYCKLFSQVDEIDISSSSKTPSLSSFFRALIDCLRVFLLPCQLTFSDTQDEFCEFCIEIRYPDEILNLIKINLVRYKGWSASVASVTHAHLVRSSWFFSENIETTTTLTSICFTTPYGFMTWYRFHSIVSGSDG